MAIVIEKKSIVDLYNNGGLFHALPKDIQILIEVLATEIDFKNVDALSVTFDTKILDAYSFPTETAEKVAEYEALSYEEKLYVQRTLFGVTREEYENSPEDKSGRCPWG